MTDKTTFAQSSTEAFAIFVDSSTDNITGVTGVATEIETNMVLSKAGGAFASVAPTVTEIGNGWYSVAPSASHRDTLGSAVWRSTATGANSVEVGHRVVDPKVTLAATQPSYAPAKAGDQMDIIDAPNATGVAVIKNGLSTFDHTSDSVAVGGYAAGQSPADLVDLSGVATGTALTALSNKVGTPVGASVSADIAAVKTNTETLLSRVTSTVATLWANLTAMISGSGGTAAFTETALENAPTSSVTGGDATEAKQNQILAALSGKVIKVTSRTANGTDLVSYIGDDDVGTNAQKVIVLDTGSVLHDYLKSAAVDSVTFGAGRGDGYNEILGTVDKTAITHDVTSAKTTIPVEILSTGKAAVVDCYTYHVKAITVTDAYEYVHVEGTIDLRPERRKVVS